MIVGLFARHACQIQHELPEHYAMHVKIGDLIEIIGRKLSPALTCSICGETNEAEPSVKIRTEEGFICWMFARCVEIAEGEYDSIQQARENRGIQV